MSDVKKNMSSNRLMLLITVVNRKKAEFFVDFIQGLGTNIQFITFGEGSAGTSVIGRMELENREKAIIFSIIREDRQDMVLRSVNEKFKAIKNGKGIAYTIPFSSVIGASVYNFMTDNRSLFK